MEMAATASALEFRAPRLLERSTRGIAEVSTPEMLDMGDGQVGGPTDTTCAIIGPDGADCSADGGAGCAMVAGFCRLGTTLLITFVIA